MPVCAACGRESPDGFNHCGHCGAALTAPAPERRKLATLVFCDLSGSTAMGERVDAETVRSLMLSYFHEMRGALERHGGTVEKFVGDAVLAVFGVPEAHEDDALRACRAALEMQARLTTLNEELERRFGTRIALRIGVNTGEVVAGDASERETFVTGDPVNVAARLEQAAGPGEVLLGEATYRLVRDAVQVEPVEPLRAKGKSEPVPAYRLLGTGDLGPVVRRVGTPFTGREEQLELLVRELRAVIAGPDCRLVTLVGEPGVGKSRLVSEFVSRVGTGARVVGGTCLSYGEGITYWAVSQIVRELVRIKDEHSPAEARRLIEAHVADAPDGPAVGTRIAQLLGLADGSTTAQQTAAAIRDFLVAGAAQRPLIVVVDDIQWAEPTLLDLLAGLPEETGHAPILLLCLARPELTEQRPDWQVAVRLEPFGGRDVDELLAGLLGPAEPAVLSRLAAVSGGNPLFVEELVAMLVDDGVLRVEGGVCTLERELDALTLPASLHALLGARLDRLEPEARGALERGAVEGEVFHRSAVVELTPAASRGVVRSSLEALMGKYLVRPADASFAGEAAFRFKHILVRDATYHATAKRLRATLHEQFADWLDRVAGERILEYEEILGYHLEQSFRYRVELGPVDDEISAVGVRAAGHLAAAGRRAASRGDIGAASGLLGRAATLLPVGHPTRARIVVDLGAALMEAGRNAEAVGVLDELDGASGVDEVSRALAEVCRGEIELQLRSTTAAVERFNGQAQAAIELFAEHDDEQALLRACWLSYLTSMTIGRSSAAREAIDRLRALTERRLHPLAGRLPGMLAMNLGWGPMPVPEALTATDALLLEVRDDPSAEPFVLGGHAYLLAQSGDIQAAREALERMREIAERQGQRIVLWGSWGQNVGRTELLAGDPERAEQALRPSYHALREAGNRAFSSTAAGQLAIALVELGRFDDAAHYAAAAADEAGEADVLSQVLWRSALARALSEQDDPEGALRLADEAVRLAATTEWPNVIADAFLDRARVVLASAPEGRNAAEDIERARVVYLAKANTAGYAKATILASATRPHGQATTGRGGAL